MRGPKTTNEEVVYAVATLWARGESPTYREIAKLLGLGGTSTAYGAIQRAITSGDIVAVTPRKGSVTLWTQEIKDAAISAASSKLKEQDDEN